MESRYLHIHEITLIIIKRLRSEFMSVVHVRVIYAFVGFSLLFWTRIEIEFTLAC